MQQRCDEPQVTSRWWISGQKRENSLMDFQVATIDPIIVADHEGRQLNVLILQRLHHAVDLFNDDVERTKRLLLEQCEPLIDMLRIGHSRKSFLVGIANPTAQKPILRAGEGNSLTGCGAIEAGDQLPRASLASSA